LGQGQSGGAAGGSIGLIDAFNLSDEGGLPRYHPQQDNQTEADYPLRLANAGCGSPKQVIRSP